MSLRIKILMVVACVIAFTAVVSTTIAYFHQKEAFLEGIDRTLKGAAYGFNFIVPPSYHDRVTGPGSVSKSEYRDYLRRLSAYSGQAGITYLYSYVEKNGAFFIASTSATAEELKNHEEASYFERYERPPRAMLKTWQSGDVTFADYQDEWGVFRSIFMRGTTPAGRHYIVGADISLDFIKVKLNKMLLIHAAMGLSIFFLALLATYFLVNAILTPIRTLARTTRELSENDFRLPASAEKEIDSLAQGKTGEIALFAEAFGQMNARLVHYIEELKRTTAERQRVESELEIAHDIQMNFLPQGSPDKDIACMVDLYAGLWPAREVGGDLYDYFLTRDGRLLFAIGDVSDKGVPAALFMAVTKAIMKGMADSTSDPGELLLAMNQELIKNNRAMMFVTMFCALLEPKTGQITYASAGHNPPLLIKGKGECSFLKTHKALPLGVFPSPGYVSQQITLEPGEGLLLYTDGVTEARGPGRELFGDNNFFEYVNGVGLAAGAKELVKAVEEKIRHHAAGTPQSDDITMLALKYLGSRVSKLRENKK